MRAAGLLSDGFEIAAGFKLKMGAEEPAADVARVEAVAERPRGIWSELVRTRGAI